MSSLKSSAIAAFLTVVGTGVIAQGAIIMDATTHNGSFTDGTTYAQYWDTTGGGSASASGGGPTTPPTGWAHSGLYVYNGAYSLQAYDGVQVFNNTGEQVGVGNQFTISGDAGSRENGVIDFLVVATQNADGTGLSQVLAHAQATGTPGDTTSYTLTTVSNTGAVASPSLALYYIQARIDTANSAATSQNNFYDNIVITSTFVPEPASLGFLGAGAMLLAGRRRRRSRIA